VSTANGFFISKFFLIIGLTVFFLFGFVTGMMRGTQIMRKIMIDQKRDGSEE